ncbi:MAG: hypothetical protein GXP04_03185 [Alphaproteobacteria bacterium]|nr:hypothetical protein [Alphaproteobacteria bacterium]
MRIFSKLATSVLCAASLGVFGAALATPVSFSNITASWTDISPATGITISNNNSANPSMRWGTPATNAGQSGYDFLAAGDFSVNAPPNQQVTLGTFSHLNNPITGTSLSSATLNVAIDIAINGVDQGSRNFMFDFSHFETPNNANPCANGGANGSGVNVNGCADLVTVTNNNLSEDFLVDGVLYTIAILGFKVGDDIVSTFETIERMTNNAVLIATITVAEVPIPGALILMLSGVMGLGFAGRTKKKA